MPTWLNEAKLLFLAAALVFGGTIYYVQNGWETLATVEGGGDRLGGGGGGGTQTDEFSIASVSPEFDSYSDADGRNVFEALSKMLPLPPVPLSLPQLPETQVLAPLPDPAPPAAHHSAFRLPEGSWTLRPSGAAEIDPTGVFDTEEEGDEPEEDDDPPAAELGREWQDERVRPHDTLIFNSGATRDGRLVREIGDSIIWENVDEGMTRTTFQRRDIKEIVPARSLAEVIEEDFATTRVTDDARYERLFEKCLADDAPAEVVEVAERWALRVCEGAEHDLDLYLMLAEYFESRFDLEAELAIYEAAVRVSGEFPPVQVVRGLADLYLRVGLTSAARRLLEDTLRRRRDDIELRALLAKQHLESGRTAEAVELYKDLGASALTEPRTAQLYGEALYREGDLVAARAALSPAVEGTDAPLADAQLLLGVVELVEGNLADAQAIFEEVLAIDDPSLFSTRSRAAYNLGVLRVLEGDGDSAMDRFEEAVALDPTNAQPLVGMAFCHERASDAETAAATYGRALEVQPELGYAQLGLGRIAEAAGDPYEDVRALYQLAFVQDFELSDAVARLGYLAARAGESGEGAERTLEALDYLAEAARRNPDDALLQLQVAHCHLQLGDVDRAEKIFTDVMRDDPENADAVAGLAYVKNAKGEELLARKYMVDVGNMRDVRAELATFASEAASAIEVNLARWRWLDGFNRSGDQPRREWSTLQEVGVEVRLDPEATAVRISGTQAPDAADAPTRLDREIDPGTFVSFSARIDAEGAEKAMACVSMRFADEKRPTELLWGRNAKGELAWRLDARGEEGEWNAISDYPPGAHDLEIQVRREKGKRRNFVLLLDGIVIFDEDTRINASQLTSPGSRNIRVGVACSAPAFQQYTVLVDDVVIVEERPKK